MLEAYLAELDKGRTGAAVIHQLTQAVNRATWPLLAAWFEAMFRLGEYEAIVANFPSAKERVKKSNRDESDHILTIVYQTELLLGSEEAEQIRAMMQERGVMIGGERVDRRSFEIMSRLSMVGRKAYEAAMLDLASARDRGDLWKDAGMISLGFFRVLEWELNRVLVHPSLSQIDSTVLAKLYNGLSPKRQESWEIVYESSRRVVAGKSQGLELGPLETWLGHVRKAAHPGEESLRDLFRSPVLNLLTKQGQRALDAGEIEGLIKFDKRERYRNPPAHTRFVPLAIARECKEYVDRSLESLFSWVRASSEQPG